MVSLRPSWGSLALRALAAAWAAVVAGWNLALAHTFWRLVFWWKKQTGWLDLGREITVTGTITAVDMNVAGLFNDGDVCFNVRLDFGWEWAITGFGGRRTSEDGGEPSIHCEIPPWTRSKFDGLWQKLAVGKRVAVTGAWGFDGVHVGAPEPIEIVLALLRHMPNVQDGWFELHPVTHLEFLP